MSAGIMRCLNSECTAAAGGVCVCVLVLLSDYQNAHPTSEVRAF